MRCAYFASVEVGQILQMSVPLHIEKNYGICYNKNGIQHR